MQLISEKFSQRHSKNFKNKSLASKYSELFQLSPHVIVFLECIPGGGGHSNVTWRGGAHFLRISTTRLGKKFAFRYPVSELLDYKDFQKQ